MCVECNQVAHITDYDCSPQYLCDGYLEEITEKPMDDTEHFMVQHKDHKIEDLMVIKDSFISEGRYGEPLKVSYLEATNGKERFVIKGWREDINSPLQYEIISGYIKTTFTLEIQSNEIRKQMSEEIKDPPIAETKIERFIQIIEKVVSQPTVSDKVQITAETDTPLISHCKMNTNSIKEISNLSKEIFDAKGLKKVEQFIHRNNNYNQPMTLLLKRKFTVKKKHTIPLESKKEQALPDGIIAQRSSR
jgi:hypothetical protein